MTDVVSRDDLAAANRLADEAFRHFAPPAPPVLH
jgi:hypothetical protein